MDYNNEIKEAESFEIILHERNSFLKENSCMLVCRNLSAYETVIHLPNTLTWGILNEILIVYKIEA